MPPSPRYRRRAMPRKPKKAYHHGDLRNSLLAAAEPLLARKGVTGWSLREVAKAAGVSHAAPYRHFRDKTALIEALAAEGFRKLQRACEEAERNYPADPARQLVEAGMGYLLFATEKPMIVHLMFGGVIALDDCSEALARAADTSFQSLVRIVQNGQNAGLYRKADTFDLTLAAWSMVYGLSLMITAGMLEKRAGTRSQVKILGDTIADILLSGMLKR